MSSRYFANRVENIKFYNNLWHFINFQIIISSFKTLKRQKTKATKSPDNNRFIRRFFLQNNEMKIKNKIKAFVMSI